MSLFKKITDYKNDFTTYPRTFEGYKWYKPILIAVIAAILYGIMSLIATRIAVMMGILPSGGIEAVIHGNSISIESLGGIFTSFLIVLFIPAIYIPSKLLKERPFSSYLSIDGWKWDVFFKSFAICLVVYVIINGIDCLVRGATFDNKFTLLTLVLAIVVTPFQCFAEEYMFRGFFMQTFGSWFKIPVVTIIIQAVIFTVFHGYNSLGQANVLILGIVLGIVVWYTKGLEVSSAVHSINNLVAFLTAGFGLAAATSQIMIWDFILSLLMIFISIAAIFLIDRKWNWIGLEREC